MDFLFILSLFLIGKYLVVFIINLLSNPPKKIKMRKYLGIEIDEIIIITSLTYSLYYILY